MTTQARKLFMACIVMAHGVAALRADPDPDAMSARVNRLIERLGHGVQNHAG